MDMIEINEAFSVVALANIKVINFIYVSYIIFQIFVNKSKINLSMKCVQLLNDAKYSWIIFFFHKLLQMQVNVSC